jgi:ParB family chromosome partitioning protein
MRGAEPGVAEPNEPDASVEGASAAAASGAPYELEIARIRPNPDQPRRHFAPDQLHDLATSIARHGVLQPVVVRRAEDGDYELIVGERRWRASQDAGLRTIPAVVADIAPQDRLEVAIVENVQRHDLNPMELAHAYRALSETGHTQDEIGRRVGLDRSSVANHLRLLELPREIQADVEVGRLSLGHAKAVLQAGNPERQRQLRERIVREHLSVRATEQLAREYAGPARARPPRKASEKVEPAPPCDPRLEPLAEALRQRLQTQVRIRGDLEKGQLEIDYFGAEDLERIAEMVLGDG